MKNVFKILGITVLAAVMVFSMLACESPSNSGGGNSKQQDEPGQDEPGQDEPGIVTIRFATGNGYGTAPESITFKPGDTITLPGQGEMTAPTGQIFSHWASNIDINGRFEFAAGESVVTIPDSYGYYYGYSNDCTFTAQWTTKKYTSEGIYVSLISFAGNADILGGNYSRGDFVLLDYYGESTLSSILDDSYYKSRASGTALFYAAHKALANLTANEDEYSSDISSVNMITFTDGLDNGSFGASNSNPIEGKSGIASNDYATYVHDEIGKRKIGGKSITAYSVGVRGSDVEDVTQFSTNLGNLASSDDNVTEITDMSDLQEVFSDIAESLTVATHFAMTTTQDNPGTVVRMTFDVTGTSSADAAASSKYIEGTLAYSGGTYTFTDVKYSGITSDVSSGGTVTGTMSGASVDFMFRNISGYDNTATIQQWTKPSAESSTWQRNSEYSASNATSSSTVLVQLVLDASTSLSDPQVTQIRAAAKDFINTLYDRVNN